MRRTWEASGKNVEEAIEAGLRMRNVRRDEVEIEVLDEGSRTLFGLIGRRNALVRLSREVPDAPIVDAGKAASGVSAAETPAQASETALEQGEAKQAADEKAATKPADKPAAMDKPPLDVPGVVEIRFGEAETAKPQPDSETAHKQALVREFLEALTQRMGLSAEVRMEMRDDMLVVKLEGEQMGSLIGYRGETLDAIQYLTSLYVNKDSDAYLRVQVDTENYRVKREETLIRLAQRMAAKAQRSQRRIVMEPMNPYERRVLHSALQGHPYVTTHSEGEEPNRRVVITLK